MTTYILHKFVEKMEHLNLNKIRSKGFAPHKPLLLLTIIELIERGQIHENKIYCSPDLERTFRKYWDKVIGWNYSIAIPFFFLKSDGFWDLHSNIGCEDELRNTKRIDTSPKLRRLVAYAIMDEALFILLTNPQYREVIRQTLIDSYLPNLKSEIESLIQQQRLITEQQIEEYRQLLLHRVEQPFSLQNLLEPIQSETPIRSAGFRKTIMGLYNYTCAVCELRIVTDSGESATDAAHIIPFSISQDDDVRNGISLCKLHHWAFDTGLISLNEIYRVIISQLTKEQGPIEWMLAELQDKPIRLPESDRFYPAQDALSWHRKKVLRR